MEADEIEDQNQTIEIEQMLLLLAFLMPEVRMVDPLCEYFLMMCRMALLEAEQERCERLRRH